MTADSLEMRERPQIPPKPANLRLNNIPAVPSHTALVAADAVNALNTASESPAPSLQSASRALDAAATTPKISPPVSPQQHKGQDGAAGHVPNVPSSMSITKPSMQVSASKQAAAAARKRAVSDFEFGQTLGEGSYSTVVEATEKATGRVFAAKILDKRHIIKEKKTKYVNIERDILQALNHPFIVRLHYAFQDSQSLYFIIDMASNGELLTWIRKLGGLSEECARFYLAEIITAVEYMHAERTLHRDIKPENILLGSDMHILVTDFGTAKMFRKGEPDQRAYSFVGTAEYVSPELLTDKAADRNSDLWAVGCIAYQLFTGRPPFKGSNEYQTFQKILKLDYTLPLTMPPQARDMVERILVLDPEKRLGATQCGGIEALKAHSFFHGFEWRDLLSHTPPQMAGPTAVSGEPRKVPPAIPPKPVLLRQQPAFSGGGEDVRTGLYDTHGSSSDGFGTEKGSDDSFSATPSASTDPFVGYNPPNLSNYQVGPPISPLQAPASEIYNVRLNDHVPAPLKAEEMAEVENYHRTNGRHPQPMSPSTTDYYANMSYRPPGQPVHSVYNTNNFGRTGRDTMGGIGSVNGNSWTSKLKAVLCCGG
ncbi:3-phosphoinositide dependent protein kinase-1 [Coemansia sp. RSA 1365]|nr:3-phosphoinositide dependent protein kinase-1 [Coemansia sp. RSA 1365]